MSAASWSYSEFCVHDICRGKLCAVEEKLFPSEETEGKETFSVDKNRGRFARKLKPDNGHVTPAGLSKRLRP